jgi:DNA topoisomerase-1
MTPKIIVVPLSSDGSAGLLNVPLCVYYWIAETRLYARTAQCRKSPISGDKTTVKLLIVESPAKSKKIASILGTGWRVEASVGHIRDLPLKEMGVAAPDFEPMYELTERGKQVVGRLKKGVADASDVFLATDPDREGEAISWHLQQALRIKNAQRVTFNEITAAAVRAAVSAPRAIDAKLVAAQETRRVLDRLVGYLVSPEVSRRVGGALSAGRVQSPALRLIVEREREIDAFVSKVHYIVRLAFAGAPHPWTADWDFKPLLGAPSAAEQNTPVQQEEPQGNPEDLHWTDRAFAEKVAKLREMAVIECREGESKSSPPAPYITSTLQQAASATLSLGPQAAMRAAQGLFEQGHITYHRTDNPNLSADALKALRAYLLASGLPLSSAPRTWKSRASAQEAHEAIRPTDFAIEEAGESDDERKLYRLIRMRTLASQMADARYATRLLILEALQRVDEKTINFVARGRKLIFPGWLQLTNRDAADEDENGDPVNPVPQLAVGDRLVAKDGHLIEKTTQPPARYTEAGLIKKLEHEGIGRPSTYATIIAGLSKRSYVEIRKKRMHPTPTAFQVVDELVGRFKFVDLGFTRAMEEELDRVASGEAAYLEVVTSCHDQLQSEIKALGACEMPFISTQAKYPCTCGKGELRLRKGKRGPFWGCSTYPACNETRPDEKGKPGARTAPPAQPGDGEVYPCPKCKAPLRLVRGPSGSFWGCSAFRASGCKGSLPDDNGKPGAPQPRNGPEQPDGRFPCPECGKPMRLRNGRRGLFWGCSGYPDCNRTAEDAGGRPDCAEEAA